MANRIRGITVEINGDTTNLQKSLSGVDKSIGKTQSQLKDVEKLLKLDPTNTELLSQKQRLLGEAVKDTKERLESLKTASEEAAKTKDNYDAWKAKYDPIKKEIGKTSEELKKLKEQSEKADEQLSKGEISQEEYDKLQNKVKETSDKLKDLRKDAEKVSEEFGHPISQEQYDAIQREIIDTEHELQNLQREAESSRTALVQIGNAGEGLQKVGEKISGADEALMPVTAAIAGVGAAGTLSFAEVDKTMQLANKTMNNTAEEAEAVNAAMKEAASNSTFGMAEASNAVLNFSRAGLDAEQSISALTPAMNLAAGEGGNLDTVSAGLVATLNGFHAEFSEAGEYADIFAAACNNSALDIDSLSESMSVAAPIFSAAGYDVKDVTLALGLMGNAGIDASTSANSLKTGIARLVDTTEEGETALRSMGFGASDAAEQEAKLHKAQNLLEEKAANLTAKQTKYNEVLAKYGEGSSQVASAQAALIKAENDLEQAQNTVNALTEEAANGTSAYGALMVDEEGKMRPFEDVLKDLHGAFAGLSEQEQISAATALFGTNQMTPWLALLNTAPERVDELSGSLHNCDGLTQEMADTMMSGFGGGIEKLKSSIDVLVYNIGESLAPILQKAIDAIQGLVDKFNALSPAQKETIAKIALVAAAIAPLLIVVGKLTTGIGGMMIVFSKMPAIMTKIKGGFTAVKVALSGAVGTMLIIVGAITTLVAAFKHLWETNEDFRNNIIAIWDGIKATFENFTSGIVDRLNALGFDFSSFTDSLKYAWDWFCNYLAPIFETTFQYIADILGNAVDVILGIVDFFIGLFTGNWEQCWTGIKEFFGGIWDAISNTIGTVFELILNIFNVDFDKFLSCWTTGWNSIKDFFSNIWNAIKNFFSDAGESIKNTGSKIKENIENSFNNAVNFVKNLASEAGSWGKDIISGIVSGIKSKIEDVTDAVKGVADKIRSFLHFSVPDEGPLTDFESWMPDFMQGLADGISANASMVNDALSTFGNNVTTALTDTFRNAMSNIVVNVEMFTQNIFTEISNALEKLKTATNNHLSTISSSVKTVLNSIKANVSTVWNSMPDSVRTAMNTIQNCVLRVWDNVHSGVWDRIWRIRNTIADGLNSSAGCILNLVNQAWDWGYDLMQNLINGINYQMGSLGNIVSDVANMIWEYLHFSVPEKGPLTDFESWMPDFMQGLAKGIESSQKAVEKAVSGVATAMQLTLNSGLNFDLNGISGAFTGNAGTVNNYYQTDNSRTVNQTNNSPKSLSRLEIYRQTRNKLKV